MIFHYLGMLSKLIKKVLSQVMVLWISQISDIVLKVRLDRTNECSRINIQNMTIFCFVDGYRMPLNFPSSTLSPSSDNLRRDSPVNCLLDDTETNIITTLSGTEFGSPLRTVQASFPAHGSSLCKVLCY